LTVEDAPPLYDDSVNPLELRTWYRHEDIIPMIVGYASQGMQTYFEWTYAYVLPAVDKMVSGLYYRFPMQFSSSENTPIVLNVNYLMATDVNFINVKAIYAVFAIRVDGGAYDGSWLTETSTPEYGAAPAFFAGPTQYYLQQDFAIDINSEETLTINKSFNFSYQYWNGVAFYTLWEQLGRPANQEFTIMFYPLQVVYNDASFAIMSHNYIGDIAITITQADVLNKLTYHINEDFLNTKTVDIDFFDLDNVNFSNGFIWKDGDDDTKTTAWVSEDSPVAIPLMDIYAKNVFRNYSKTIHTLTAIIRHDGYMKPFSILTDDNLLDDSAEEIKLILQKYTWDLFNGTYEIEAQEYTDEVITLDESGNVVTPSNLGAPTGLALNQVAEDEPVDVLWNAVTGATGYILQRKPYFNGSDWIAYWTTIYVGNDLSYEDDIDTEGELPDSDTVTYRIAAYNTIGVGANSAEVEIVYDSSY